MESQPPRRTPTDSWASKKCICPPAVPQTTRSPLDPVTAQMSEPRERNLGMEGPPMALLRSAGERRTSPQPLQVWMPGFANLGFRSLRSLNPGLESRDPSGRKRIGHGPMQHPAFQPSAKRVHGPRRGACGAVHPFQKEWCAVQGSNLRPRACEARALPLS